ncbi:MAG: YhfC family glutamic-type intramembrane protease [Polyangiales bacterium]
MSNETVVVVQALAMMLLPLAAVGAYRRASGAKVSVAKAGAGAFTDSFYMGLRFVLAMLIDRVDPLWLKVILLGLLAGVCEEGARYMVMRRLKDTRGEDPFRAAVMFGLGHGGMESALLGLSLLMSVVGAVSGLGFVTIAAGNTVLWLRLLAVAERAMAIVLHVGCSLLVMRAARTGDGRYGIAAVALHATVNAGVLWVLLHRGPFKAEAAMAVMTVGVIALIAWMRGRMGEALPDPDAAEKADKDGAEGEGAG